MQIQIAPVWSITKSPLRKETLVPVGAPEVVPPTNLAPLVAVPSPVALKSAAFDSPETVMAVVAVVKRVVLDGIEVPFIDVAVATPSAGVTNVGDVERTFAPEPVEVVTPVPPLATARVPELTCATDVTVGDVAVPARSPES